MKTFLALALSTLLIGGSIYLFLEKPAPSKYIDLVVRDIPPKDEDTINILFVGDIMLDRGIRRVIEKNGFDYILEDVREMFLDRDLIIGNLEGTITENQSIAVKNNQILRFTFSTTTASELKKWGFSGFSMANNHALDFYQAGYEETRQNLSDAGLFSFGSPLNSQNISQVTRVRDRILCFVGYHSLYNSTTTTVISEISSLENQCDWTTVMSHWGEEYEDYENEEQRIVAHSFIDAGADLVIGHHPHVIQPIEIYKDKVIFYSLGNFIFDQDFSVKTRQGIGVELILGESGERLSIIPIEIYGGKLYFPAEADLKERIGILSSKLELTNKEVFETYLKLEITRKQGARY